MDASALPAYSVDRGHAPIVAHAAWLGEGDFCACYLVNHSDVFRFAKHATASAAMQIECCLLPILLGALPIAVPAVRFVGHHIETGHALMGYPLLPGEPLERAVFERLPATQQHVLIAQLAAIMRQLHALPLERIDRCALPVLDPLTYLTRVMADARMKLVPQLTNNAWRYHEALWACYLGDPALQRYQPALLHGDLSPDHVLANTAHAQLTGLLDFGDACIGDPAWDLIYIVEDYSLQTFTTFLKYYDAPNAPLLARKARLYQQLSNIAYALMLLDSGDTEQVQAVLVLEEQATTSGTI